MVKVNLTSSQIEYLASLRNQLNNLEILGKSSTEEWWSICESIDSIENNL